MNMDHPEEDIILDDVDDDKNDNGNDEEEGYCARVRQSTRESRTVETLEPQWDNQKSHLKLEKEKKVTFEDDMPNIKTKMNHIFDKNDDKL